MVADEVEEVVAALPLEQELEAEEALEAGPPAPEPGRTTSKEERKNLGTTLKKGKRRLGRE